MPHKTDGIPTRTELEIRAESGVTELNPHEIQLLDGGTVHQVGEPEFVGEIPIRTELTVLPADDGAAREIGWTVTEYNGAEISTVPDGLTHEELMDLGNWPEGFEPELIIELGALHEGDLIRCPTLFGDTVARVVDGENGYYGISLDGSHIYPLSHGEDDRQCWICTGAANVRAIQRLELDHGEE